MPTELQPPLDAYALVKDEHWEHAGKSYLALGRWWGNQKCGIIRARERPWFLGLACLGGIVCFLSTLGPRFYFSSRVGGGLTFHPQFPIAQFILVFFIYSFFNYVNRIYIDRKSGIWTMESGICPFYKTISGEISEIDCLEMCYGNRYTHWRGDYKVWSMLLKFKRDDMPQRVFRSHDLELINNVEDVERAYRKVAEDLGIRFVPLAREAAEV